MPLNKQDSLYLVCGSY